MDERSRRLAVLGGPALDKASVPGHIKPMHRDAYMFLAELAPELVLRQADTPLLHQAAILYSEMTKNPARFSIGKHKFLLSLLGHLGCTPSDRARMSIPIEDIPAEGEDRLAFLKKLTAQAQ